MNNLYSLLETKIRGVSGFTPMEQLFALLCLTISSNNIQGNILEVGSWCGLSSIALGLGSKSTKTSTVYCVDLFPNKDDWYQNEDKSFSFETKVNGKELKSYDVQTVWEETFKKKMLPVYQNEKSLEVIFNKNISNAGLSDIIVPFKGELKDFLKHHDSEKFNLVFLDGHHSYENVSLEIKYLETKINSGGWLCFDDAFTVYDGVDKAIRENILNSKKFRNFTQLTRKMFVAQKL